MSRKYGDDYEPKVKQHPKPPYNKDERRTIAQEIDQTATAFVIYWKLREVCELLGVSGDVMLAPGKEK